MLGSFSPCKSVSVLDSMMLQKAAVYVGSKQVLEQSEAESFCIEIISSTCGEQCGVSLLNSVTEQDAI